jgi:uncharacterized coiled-coil protein SlyX
VATLTFVNESGMEERVSIGPSRPEASIGRNKECELRTKNNTVSRVHARVLWKDGQYVLVDLKSANGTYYQRKRVTQVGLEDGQSFFCGSLPVEFHLDPADAPWGEPTLARDAVDDTLAEPPPPPPEAFEDDEPAPRSPGASVHGTAAYDAIGSSTDAYAEDEVSFGSMPPPLPPEAAQVRHATRAPLVVPSVASAPIAVRRSTTEVPEPGPGPIAVPARVAELEADLAARERTIRDLGLQVEELSRCVARFEADARGEDEAQLRVAELERVLASEETEKAGLEERLEAAQALAEQGAVARDAARAEAEDLRSRVSGLTAQVADAGTELTEVKTANRSYLKKISRLLEENETLRKGASVPDRSAELAALEGRNAGLEQEADVLKRELASARAQAGRAAERITALEAAPAVAVPAEVRQVLERMNELVSETRTSLHVVGTLLPDLVERLPEGPDREDLAEQVRAAVAALLQTAGELKAEAVRGRRSLA